MIKHNLTLVLRNLWSKRVYSFVILLSLTIGFVCSAILIAFLVYETGTDGFHAKGRRIFQLYSNDPFADEGRIPYIPKPFTDYMIANYPEVEDVCQLTRVPEAVIEKEGVTFRDFIIVSADSSFFSFFDFPFIQGKRNQSVDPGHIILSAETADILFGHMEVLGRLVTLHAGDTTVQLAVSAVFGRPEANTHFKVDALVHPSVLSKKWYVGISYALLQEERSAEGLTQKINADARRPGLIGPGKVTYFLNPISESYFIPENAPFLKKRSAVFVRVVYVVCAVVLFVASFNFINLFLLFTEKRKKEVGIKKTLGLTNNGLLAFCLLEAAVYIFIASFLGLLLAVLLLPVFNTVFDSALYAAYFFKLEVIAPIAGVLFLSGAVVVFITVLKRWRMKPINLMARQPSKVRFSRVLFTFQFIIAITLTICSITIMRQMDHIEKAPLGFNRELIQMNAPNLRFSELLPVLKQKVALLPDVNNVTISGGNPISGNAIVRLELEDGRSYSPYLFSGDEDFLKTLDLELIQGAFPSKENKGNLVNETLVRQFGLTNPVGQKTPGTDGLIVGVVKDFTISSFKQQVPPVLISYHENGRTLLVDYRGNNLGRLISQLQKEWQNVFPDNFFDYQVLQVDLMNKYKDEVFLFKMVVSFSLVSIVLSCFGLFALSWAVTQNRTKEIGVRKVFGATSLDIFNLLTVSFTKRIGFAFLLAAPIGYYLMDQWLRIFVNRIDLNASVFILSGVMMMAVAALALSFHTVKATMTNPIDEMRNE